MPGYCQTIELNDEESINHQKKYVQRRKRSSISVVVSAFDVTSGNQERNLTANLAKSESRDWLQKFVLWAICNGKCVEIVNVKDNNNDAG